MPNYPQLPVKHTKLTKEQKPRLNQLIETFATVGDVMNFYPNHQNPSAFDETHEFYDADIAKTIQDFRDSLPKRYIDPIADFGLSQEDVPILMVILNSDKLYHHRKVNYQSAVQHAALALSVLQAPVAIPSLINLYFKTQDDYEDLPREFYAKIIASFGKTALEPLFEVRELINQHKFDVDINECLVEITQQDETTTATVKAYLASELQNFANQDEYYTTTLVGYMADFGMTEQLPLIRQAFEQEAIDPTYMGDMEDIEIAFGVRTERETPKPNYQEKNSAILEKIALMQQLLGKEKEFEQNSLVKSIQQSANL